MGQILIMVECCVCVEVEARFREVRRRPNSNNG